MPGRTHKETTMKTQKNQTKAIATKTTKGAAKRLPPMPAKKAPRGAEPTTKAEAKAPAPLPAGKGRKEKPTAPAKAEAAKRLNTAASGLTGAAGKIRSLGEIVDGAPKMRDARDKLHGQTIQIRPFFLRKGAIVIDPEDDVPMDALAAIPRDGDVGGEGATARAQGFLALHISPAESGGYIGRPCYVMPEELKTLRVADSRAPKATKGAKR